MHKKGRKQNVIGKETRLKLIRAAGRVFAQKGFEGAGLREISTLAGFPVSIITYHFKTKENLFFETLHHHFIKQPKLTKAFNSFLDADYKKPQSISNAMFESFLFIYQICHGKNKSPNLDGLIMCLINDSGNIAHVFQEMANSLMNHIFEILVKNNPKLSDTDIFWWGRLFWAQIFYSITGKKLMLTEMETKNYSEEFIYSMAWRSACQCCLAINLPLPSGKDKWHIKYPS